MANIIVGSLTLTAIEALGGTNSGMDDDEEEDSKKVCMNCM
jgi:hypothetical protein